MTIRLDPKRYIPYRKDDIIEMCLSGNELDETQAELFRKFSRLLHSVFHYEYHTLQEQLKDAYAPVNPDADTRTVELNRQDTAPRFIDLLETLLDKANYEKVSDADLQQALLEESMFKIRLQVDFSDFEEVLLFCRGQSVRNEKLVSWFGLRKRNIRFTNYDRVAVYLKFREDFDPAVGQLPTNRAGATLLKLFQNVPKADLEMLFPNTRVRMRTLDKFMIGVPAVVSGGIVITTKLGTTLVLIGSLIGYWIGLHQDPVELNRATVIALLAGLGALGAYLWKQVSNFRNRKLRFMQSLTRNLYFKNLDNNAGVFLRLINDAEEEECKEAVLAYYFLLVSNKALTKNELDNVIENWFAQSWQTRLDFEIDDALEKLVRLELVEVSDGQYRAVQTQEAVKKLDSVWDNYFTAA
jgi:hypothetical protein